MREAGYGWFEYFMRCSAKKPRFARINEQEALTENIKLLLRCIYASSPTHQSKRKRKKPSKKKGGKTRKWGWGDGKGGEISGWKGGRVISKKDGGKDGRV